MAVVKNLMVRAGADFSAITTQANKAKSAMGGMETSVSKSCSKMTTSVRSVGKVFAAIGSVISAAAITAFATAAKKVYDDQAASQAKLARVMRNTMDASDGEIASILELTKAQQALGVVGDEVQLAGAQELATYLGLTDSLKKLIPVMNDQHGLKATQEQAATIATMLGKVMNGQVGALSRYGYSFTAAQEAILKYGTEAQRAAVLSEVVEQSVGGMNAALAATPSGRLKQVSNTLGDIKETAGLAVNTLLTAFLPALNGLCSVLANVATLAGRVAQTIANIFGGGSSGVQKTVGYVTQAAEGMEDLTDETKAAGKATKELNSFGFDTLQQIKGTSSSSGSGASSLGASAGSTGGGSIVESIAGAEEAGESVGWLQRALEKLRDTVQEMDFFSHVTDGLTRAKKAVGSVAESFATVFENGTGQEYLTTILEITQGIAETIGGFADSFKAAWEENETGTAIIQNIWDCLNDLSGLVNKVVDRTREWATGVDFSPLLTAFEGLTASLEPFVALVSDGLLWAYENVLLPVSSWVIEEAAPVMLDTLSSAVEFFTSVIEKLKPVGEWLWDNFLQPLGKWAGDVFIIAMETVNSLLDDLTSLLRGDTSFSEFLDNLSLGETLLLAAGVAFGVVTAAVTVWNAVGAVATAISTALGTAIAFLTSPIGIAVIAISGLIAAGVLLYKNWDTISEKATEIWGGIVDFVKGAANGILGFIEGLVNGVIGGLNKMIGAMNGLSFDVPDWVPAIGGKKFGFNIPKVSSVTLPRLAEGDVIQPGKEFLAVLGDQKHGVNIEAPLETIKQGLLDAMGEAGGIGGTLKVSAGPGLTRYLSYELEKESARRGSRLIGGTT